MMSGCCSLSAFAIVIVTMCLADSQATFAAIDDDLKDLRKFMRRKLTPIMIEAIASTDLDTRCLSALIRLFQGTDDKEAWALKFVTSNGLVPPAALYLSMGALGHYGQCVTSRAPARSGGKPAFVGQFCSLYVSLPPEVMEAAWNLTIENGDIRADAKPPPRLQNKYFSARLRFGICLPSTCRAEEATDLIFHIVSKYKLDSEVTGCRTLTDESKRSPIFYVAIWTFIGLVVLVLLSTTAEYMQWTTPGDVGCMFSTITSNKQLFAPVSTKHQSLAFLNGVKALLSFWIVVLHTYIMVDTYAVYTLKEQLDYMKSIFAQISPTSAFLSIPTFFCISGFLLTYTQVSQIDSSRPVARIYIKTLLRRYIRLTLPSVAVILFSFVLPAWAHGPITDNLFQLYIESCNSNWWRAFTYTNNFDLENMCLYHYWYMSTDMQIFVVMTLLALLMSRWPRIVGAVLGLLMIGSSIWIIRKTILGDLPPAAIFNDEWAKFAYYMDAVYVKSITHVGSFVVGMLGGYLYLKTSEASYSSITSAVSSSVAIAVIVFLIFAPLAKYHDLSIPRWIKLTYAGFHRIIWSVACCWLFYLMATRNMKWLSRILSSPVLVVFGRLSFAIYLVHFPLTMYYMGVNTTYVQMAHSTMVRTAIGNYVLSSLLAYTLYILVESPTIQLDNLLFKTSKAKPKPEAPLAKFKDANNTSPNNV